MPLDQRQYESFAAAIATLRASLDDPDGDEGFVKLIADQYTDEGDLTVEERLNGALTLAQALLLALEEAGYESEKVLQHLAREYHP